MLLSKLAYNSSPSIVDYISPHVGLQIKFYNRPRGLYFVDD
jgi:hypothetical protein